MKILHKIRKAETEEGIQVTKKEGALSKLKGKMTKKRITAIICGALAVVLIGGRVISASAAQPVDTARVVNDSMVKELELNGKIRSNTVLSVYSDVECKVGKIDHSTGEAVGKGVPVIEYDKEDLEYRLKTARLNLEAVGEDYEDRVQSNNKMAGLYSEAASTLKDLDVQIAQYQAAIDQLDTDIENKAAALADEGAKLQISLIDWADEPDSEEYENLQKLVQSNSYEQGHNSALVEMKRTREEYSELLSECKQKKSEMTSQKSSSYTSMMTSAGKEKLENDKETKELSSAQNVSNLEGALNGVSTDFAGIVTNIAVKEGNT
ncbi:MAG: hypothetical protein IK123_10525, partial [Lachnospiraceae bacterium]|nr:hypothetical protein [Lachnospiraceae bacterium]